MAPPRHVSVEARPTRAARRDLGKPKRFLAGVDVLVRLVDDHMSHKERDMNSVRSTPVF